MRQRARSAHLHLVSISREKLILRVRRSTVAAVRLTARPRVPCNSNIAIMAAVSVSSSPITQVSQAPAHTNLQPQLLTRLQLDLRGERFSVDRETIMNLPESVLLCLFPNGLVLSRQSMALSDGGDNEEDDEIYGVDFDPKCFAYVLSFFRNASDAFYGTATTPGLFAAQQHLSENAPASEFGPPLSQNPLLTKQAIIVLREELEYFSIPPKDGKASTDAGGIASEALLEIKRESGQVLLSKRNIFTALQRNVNKENNVAEQHLIDMLCMRYAVFKFVSWKDAFRQMTVVAIGISGVQGQAMTFGFDREDVWGFRALEPSRCCISSIALVLLKTGIVHNGPPYQSEPAVSVDYNQMATAQKLLLFWRKPARKCWWDGVDVELNLAGKDPLNVKLWARRVWTLELSLIPMNMASVCDDGIARSQNLLFSVCYFRSGLRTRTVTHCSPPRMATPPAPDAVDLEVLVDLEQQFYNVGYEGGLQHGQIHGRIEGRELGRNKGFDMWEELGFYEGFAKLWKTVKKYNDDSDSRVSHSAQLLLNLIAQFPVENPSHTSSADLDILKLFSQIRSRYKMLCSLIGVKPSLRSSQSDLQGSALNPEDNVDTSQGKKSVWRVDNTDNPGSVDYSF
ncbi:hypothetical protein EW145_g4392 [Phellinidium pouzarii]|uniref:Uncharacterized protein n=1 Tax=Phellinidium pouzarii TaxID=167371 RepID=A0A4S4L8L8_9AGAM|nr:hypothetical protein EW145_g4392 [Phellinidium pouzarii]